MNQTVTDKFGLSDKVRLTDPGLPTEYAGAWTIEGISRAGGVLSYWLAKSEDGPGAPRFHTCGPGAFERA